MTYSKIELRNYGIMRNASVNSNTSGISVSLAGRASGGATRQQQVWARGQREGRGWGGVGGRGCLEGTARRVVATSCCYRAGRGAARHLLPSWP